jgi:hypothetical protein
MSNTKMEWSVAAANEDEVREQVNKLLVKKGLDKKYQIASVAKFNEWLTDYKVTFSLQV